MLGPRHLLPPRFALLFALSVLVAACATAGTDSGIGDDDDDPIPGSPDAAGPGGRPDASTPTPRPDAAPPGTPDAEPPAADADPFAVTFASSEVGTYDAQGLSISDRFWPGWRFEVPSDFDLHVRTVGFFTAGGQGTAFAALIALDGPDDVPAPLNLDGNDLVIPPVVFPIRGTAGDQRVRLDVTLTAGWYAVVFGTGKFGASSEQNTLITRGHRPIAGAQTPFVTMQNVADWYQATLDDLRFFVEGRRE